ncbi:hypothetical protein ACFO5R_05275 [Halosolutus amylolyticus]|uniref:Uncharacterized protein n=1 Tax=Halosolutus amylolyticus TaxID=2932267 RepID=A0ABD5PN72_9EURY|nr:hypothetical protein [Halosolutus amylolyticus]
MPAPGDNSAAEDLSTVRDAASSDRHDDRSASGSGELDASPPRLGSRILVTWIELTVVGITGGLLGAAVGGPPGFVVYLATTLLTVGIIFHNVNELVKAWLRASRAGSAIE